MESGTVDLAPPIPRPGLRRGNGASLSIRLSAVIIAATVNEPRVLTVRIGTETVEALPSGPLEVEHRTLEVGLRAWVERQTGQKLGYVEQLYTFGDRDRIETGDSRPSRALTVAYLALVREARLGGAGEAVWQNWYRHFPVGGLARRQAGRPGVRSKRACFAGPTPPQPRPSGGCAPNVSGSLLRRRGTRNWSSNATSFSTRPA